MIHNHNFSIEIEAKDRADYAKQVSKVVGESSKYFTIVPLYSGKNEDGGYEGILMAFPKYTGSFLELNSHLTPDDQNLSAKEVKMYDHNTEEYLKQLEDKLKTEL